MPPKAEQTSNNQEGHQPPFETTQAAQFYDEFTTISEYLQKEIKLPEVLSISRLYGCRRSRQNIRPTTHPLDDKRQRGGRG